MLRFCLNCKGIWDFDAFWIGNLFECEIVKFDIFKMTSTKALIYKALEVILILFWAIFEYIKIGKILENKDFTETTVEVIFMNFWLFIRKIELRRGNIRYPVLLSSSFTLQCKLCPGASCILNRLIILNYFTPCKLFFLHFCKLARCHNRLLLSATISDYEISL